MVRVYMAGAISGANPLETFRNIDRGTAWSAEVLSQGFAVYSPFIDPGLVGRATLSMEQVYAMSLEWLKVCDAVFLVPGWEDSKGTLREVEVARSLGISIYSILANLLRDKAALDGHPLAQVAHAEVVRYGDSGRIVGCPRKRTTCIGCPVNRYNSPATCSVPS